MADAKRGGEEEEKGEGKEKSRETGKKKSSGARSLPFLPTTPATHAKQNTEITTHRFCFLYIHRIKVRYSEAIRWLKTPRSLSVHTLIWFITQDDKKGDSK